MPSRPRLAAVAVAARAIGRGAVRDGPGLAGLVMISAGAAQVYAPAGLIVGGLFLVGGSFLAARARVLATRPPAEPHH